MSNFNQRIIKEPKRHKEIFNGSYSQFYLILRHFQLFNKKFKECGSDFGRFNILFSYFDNSSAKFKRGKIKSGNLRKEIATILKDFVI